MTFEASRLPRHTQEKQMPNPSTIADAVAQADAETSNVGLPTYTELVAKLRQIERLSREADRKAVDVASMLGEIASAALSPNATRFVTAVA
jgi:hypothetical protein